MEEKLKSNDFIEIDFSGKSNGVVFDTTYPDEAKEMGLETEVKPIIISIGNDMVLKGLDEELQGKEVGKEYEIRLGPEKAFGKRDPSLMKIIPMRVFKEKQINPYPGMALQLDQDIVKVVSVSGGRVTVDFNNPMAGKDVEYKVKINRLITDINEKINALQDYFLKQRFEFDIKDSSIVFNDPKLKPLVDMFNEKFKDVLGMEFKVEESDDDKAEKDKKDS